jgi:hypothetical protein
MDLRWLTILRGGDLPLEKLSGSVLVEKVRLLVDPRRALNESAYV